MTYLKITKLHFGLSDPPVALSDEEQIYSTFLIFTKAFQVFNRVICPTYFKRSDYTNVLILYT